MKNARVAVAHLGLPKLHACDAKGILYRNEESFIAKLSHQRMGDDQMIGYQL